MKIRYILLILIGLFVVNSYLVSATEINKSTHIRIPRITIPFSEVTILENFTFKDSLGDDVSANYTNATISGYYAFIFFPTQALSDGEYILSINVSDEAGNIAEDPIVINLEIVKLPLEFVYPTFGVCSHNPFNMTLSTPDNATCRWTTVYRAGSIESRYLNYGTFNENNSMNHTVTDLNLAIHPSPFYAICNDSYGFLNDYYPYPYELIIDPTPPDFTIEPFSDPSIVTNQPPTSKFILETDELTICKWDGDRSPFGTDKKDYDLMSNEFPGWDDTSHDSYVIGHTDNISGYNDDIVYSFNVKCENLAELESVLAEFQVLVNKSADLIITPYPSSTWYTKYAIGNNLAVSTNRENSLCNFRRLPNGEDVLFDIPSPPLVGSLFTKTLEDPLNIGDNRFDVTCVSTVAGIGDVDADEQINIIYDPTPPNISNIDDGNVTCRNRYIEAEWEAEDLESGVSGYRFAIGESKCGSANFDSVLSWTNISSSGDRIHYDKNGRELNLTDGTTYYWNVRATNQAGLESECVSSDGIKIELDSCPVDEDAPAVWASQHNQSGYSILELRCLDVGPGASGCDPTLYFYGIDRVSKDCRSQTKYVGVVNVTRDVCKGDVCYFCYKVHDVAKNFANGTVTVDLRGAFCFNDNDGDGRGNGCSLGPDCNDTDNTIYQNCSSGCIQDTDGDSYGLGCYNGDDCDDLNSARNLVCGEGCIFDHDQDGYGLGCLKGPDCDDTDATLNDSCESGCVQDTDGDGYGLGCIDGLDCNDTDALSHNDCENNCIQDTDGDGYGLNCEDGLDCDDAQPAAFEYCLDNCIQDADGDKYGLGCDNGFDCDDTNPLEKENCLSECLQDGDGDTYGLGCFSGFDCNDLNPNLVKECGNGCKLDTDGDTYGLGCDNSFDCNDADPGINEGCDSYCIHDNEGDGYGIDCTDGSDCDGTNPYLDLECDTLCVLDLDGDSYGLGCEEGPDCDDYDPIIQDETCSSECTFDEECDRLDDSWEETYGLDLSYDDSEEDLDFDHFSNIEEYRAGTDPTKPPDGMELDTDGDGIPDDWERQYSECAGLDFQDPSDATNDFDNDGLDNLLEYQNGVNPCNEDTDGDGWKDGKEVRKGTDPTDPESHPRSIFWTILIIILVLTGLGFGGYYGYNYYLEMQGGVRPVAAKPTGVKPTIRKVIDKITPAALKIRQLRRKRRIAARKEKSAYFNKFKTASGKGKVRGPQFATQGEGVFAAGGGQTATKKSGVTQVIKPISEGDKTKKEEKPKTDFDKLSDITKKKSDFGKLFKIIEESKSKEESGFEKLGKISKKKESVFDKIPGVVKKPVAKKAVKKPVAKGKSVFDKLAEVEKKERPKSDIFSKLPGTKVKKAKKTKKNTFEELGKIAKGKKK